MVAERTIVDITKGDGESHVDGRRRLIHYFLAKKQYKLNDRDMGTLEFERRISNNGNNMKQYPVPKAQALKAYVGENTISYLTQFVIMKSCELSRFVKCPSD